MKILIGALAALTLVACGKAEKSSTDVAPAPAPAPTETATQSPAPSSTPAPSPTGDIILSGQFSGRSDHVTTGAVSIVKEGDGYMVVLGPDFSLDGAPDPVLGFGNGEYSKETKFSDLQNKNGAQSYRLPEGFDPASFSEIYVWCEQFAVPLGVASLN